MTPARADAIFARGRTDGLVPDPEPTSEVDRLQELVIIGKHGKMTAADENGPWPDAWGGRSMDELLGEEAAMQLDWFAATVAALKLMVPKGRMDTTTTFDPEGYRRPTRTVGFVECLGRVEGTKRGLDSQVKQLARDLVHEGVLTQEQVATVDLKMPRHPTLLAAEELAREERALALALHAQVLAAVVGHAGQNGKREALLRWNSYGHALIDGEFVGPARPTGVEHEMTVESVQAWVGELAKVKLLPAKHGIPGVKDVVLGQMVFKAKREVRDGDAK